MKKIICVVLILSLTFVLTACQVGNCQVGWDTTQTFTHAILKLDNGELIEGKIDSWRDFSESDTVQVTIGGITYLTHYSNVILCSSKP